MQTVSLPTQPRQAFGKSSAAKVRKQGLIPAIIYGHKKDPVAVALPHEPVEHALRHHARLVALQLPGGEETAIIKEIQRDHLGRAVLHLDFERVDKDERIEVEVELELKGTAPGTSAGVLEQPLHVLKIECAAVDVPESIKVNISNLQLGGVIHVKELTIPAGIKVLSDPDAVVVQIKAPVAEVEAPVGPPPEGGAEPEIVGRRVKADEDEEK